MDYIKKIDDMGGAPQAIENGYIQQEIQKAAYDYQKSIESKENIVVGVNKHQIEERPPENLLKVDMSVQERQLKKLKKVKEERDNQKVQATLAILKEKAQTDENLFPYVLDAVKTYASLGEICNTLRDVFGEYNQKIF